MGTKDHLTSYRDPDPKALRKSESAQALNALAKEGHDQLAEKRAKLQRRNQRTRDMLDKIAERRCRRSLSVWGSLGQYSWRLLAFPGSPIIVVLTLIFGLEWLSLALLGLVPFVVALLKTGSAARTERRWLEELPFTVTYEAYLREGRIGSLDLVLRWKDSQAELSMLKGLFAAKHLEVDLEHRPDGATVIVVPDDAIWTIFSGNERATNYPAYRFFKIVTERVLLKLNEVHPIESVTLCNTSKT